MCAISIPNANMKLDS